MGGAGTTEREDATRRHDRDERAETLKRAYGECRRMQRRHDPTFYLATLRLPRSIRPSVHAVYGFVREADEIVDGDGRALDPTQRLARLDRLAEQLASARRGEDVTSLPALALADAGERHDLPLDELDAYMDSMRRDIRPIRIESWGDLNSYMEGSAGSVGRIMAPLLGAPSDASESFGRLALAFQLTNFIRDLREDYWLGRVYLPADELESAGVAPDELAGGVAGDGLREVIELQVDRARELFAQGGHGANSVAPPIRAGICLARSVYERTLDRIERLGFDAVGRRASLPPAGIAVALAAGLRSGT